MIRFLWSLYDNHIQRSCPNVAPSGIEGRGVRLSICLDQYSSLLGSLLLVLDFATLLTGSLHVSPSFRLSLFLANMSTLISGKETEISHGLGVRVPLHEERCISHF